MNQESSETYSIGNNKDEANLKRLYASFKAETNPVWIFLLAFIILTGLDLVLNVWVGWNEFLLRTLAGAALLVISFFLRPYFPLDQIKEDLKPENYDHVILVMKKYHRITFLKVIRLVLFYVALYLALYLLLRHEESSNMADFLTFSWFDLTSSRLIIFALMFIYTLYILHSNYTRLNKIEQI